MVYGFDENKGKVDINAILDELETNYQGNIDTLYNAIVAKGVTPASKNPADIAAAIQLVYNVAQDNCTIAAYSEVSGRGTCPSGDSASFTVNTGHADATGVYLSRATFEAVGSGSWSGYGAVFILSAPTINNGVVTVNIGNTNDVDISCTVRLIPYKLNKT